jgi:NagD protein
VHEVKVAAMGTDGPPTKRQLLFPDDPPESYLIDMDGVLVHEGRPLPGSAEFIQRLIETERRFMVLTNNSIYTPRDLRARLLGAGIDIGENALWTSALATAQFLDSQRPNGTAHVVGEAGLTTALHEIGYVLTEVAPTTWYSVRHGPTALRASPARSD